MELELTIAQAGNDEESSTSCTVADRAVFGRDLSSPVPLDGTGISREHFALTSKEGEILVEDLSTNGTWLNGQRLPKREMRRLTPGDNIEVPGTRIGVRWETPVPLLSVETAPPEPASGLAPAPRLPWMAPVSNFLASFSWLEKFAVISAVCSLVFVLAYSLN